MNKFACMCEGIHVESLSPKVEKRRKIEETMRYKNIFKMPWV
jgi:hypothetical protein